MRTRPRKRWLGMVGTAVLAAVAVVVPAGLAAAQPVAVAGHAKEHRSPAQQHGKIRANYFLGTDIQVGPNDSGYDTISDPNELNRYRIDTGGGTIHARISQLPADYDMELYAAGGSSPLAVSRNDGTTDDVINLSVGAGRYNLYVYSYSGTSSTPYYLQVSFPPRDTSNSIRSAPAIGSGAEISETIWGSGDVDVWSLDTGPGIIDATLDSQPADYDLRVLNANGGVVGASEAGGLTPDHVSIGVPGGRYYVEVSGYGGANNGVVPYRLRLRTFQAPSAPTGLRVLSMKRGTVTIGWAGPASDGGLPVNGYLVRISTNGGRKWTGWMPRGLQSFVKGRRIRPRSAVRVQVVATNAAGTSPIASLRFRTRR